MRTSPALAAGAVLAAILILAASCASAAGPPPKAGSAASPGDVTDAGPVVRIYDVTDLATPPGETSPDTDRTEKLAAQLRESLTFVGGAAADEAEITALGGELIVRAARSVHAQISSALAGRRAAAAPAGR